MSKIKEKLKDVATLKTAKENFFKNDGSLTQWLAHGSTEAANMLLHGHPAPVYAGNVSPPNIEASSSLEQQGNDVPMEVDSPTAKSMGILEQKMQSIHQQVEIEEPELEPEQ